MPAQLDIVVQHVGILRVLPPSCNDGMTPPECNCRERALGVALAIVHLRYAAHNHQQSPLTSIYHTRTADDNHVVI